MYNRLKRSSIDTPNEEQQLVVQILSYTHALINN